MHQQHYLALLLACGEVSRAGVEGVLAVYLYVWHLFPQFSCDYGQGLSGQGFQVGPEFFVQEGRLLDP